MANPTCAPRIPIEIDTTDDFAYISDSLENVRQDLKMILLTNPGEKLMDPTFGVGIRKYLFEPTAGMINVGTTDLGYRKINLQNFEQNILVQLTTQVNKYNPEIVIENISAAIEENVMFLTIYYNYRGFINDSIGVSINL